MIRRLAMIFLKVIATIVIILVIVIFLIQTPYVQNIIRGKAEKYLSRKLNTRVNIGNLYIKFPENVVLKNIYLEDRQKDTLLAAGLIDVNIHMWGLLHSKIDIGKVQLEGITMKVKRLLPDTAFNFQFIADAFSSPEKTPPAKEDTSAMKISLGELQLDKIRLVYRDTVTGNNVEVWIDHSQTVMKQFDPMGMHFHVSQFRMKGLQARIEQGKPLVAPVRSGVKEAVDTAKGISEPIDLQLGRIELVDSRVDYADAVGKLSTNAQIGGLTADVQAVDLDKQVFRVKAVALDSTSLRFDDNKQRRQKKGMDYAHLDVKGLSLHGNDIIYSADSISGVLTKGEMSEQSGFRLVELRTGFVYTSHETVLKGLLLRTPGTLLQRDLTLRYSSLAGIAKDPAHTLVDLDLPDSRVQVKDILVFAPFLGSQPGFRPNDVWNVDARLKGNLDNLRVERFRFSGIQDIRLDLSGTVLHPMDANRVAANLNIGSVSGSRKSLEALLPKGVLPANIAIPARFTLRGKLDGGMTGFNSNLILTTTSGVLVVKGYVQQFRDMQRARYDLAVQTRALDLGYILKDSTQWGLVTADLTTKGRGFDPQTAHAALHGRLQSAVIRGYTYHDFLFDGSITDRHVALQSSIHDTAIGFNLIASADMANKYPAVKLDWRIDTVDLHALHFVSDTLQFKGSIHADFPSTNPDSLQGRLKMDSLLLVQGVQKLTTDSILLLADHKDGIEDIQLHTEMADVDWNGRYKLSETGRALQHTINNYYRINGYKDSAFAEQDWKMLLHFRVSPLVLTYMPNLKGTDTVGGLIYFQSRYDDLGLNISAPHIQMGSQVFEHVTVKASSGGHDDGQLRYSVDLASGQGSGFALYQTSLHGWLAEDKLFTTLQLKDKKGKDRYRLAGQLEKLIDGLKFTLNPDSLLLNYDKWQVGRDNYFQYDSAGVIVHDLAISNKDETLKVNSQETKANAPIDVTFAKFGLGTLSRMADQDSLLVDGQLDGKVTIKNPMSSPVFTSDLQVQNLSYRADPVGNLSIKVDNEKADAFAADVALSGHQNDVEVKGEYNTKAGSMDMKLDMRQLNMASLKPFVTSQVKDISGYLKGSLTLKGTMDKPAINGNLHFDSTLIVPLMTGEPLRLSKDNIEFDSDGFNFSEFALQDSAGNKATLDGNVYTKDYKDFRFDLFFNANNFRLVNAPEARDRMFYGSLNMDAAANISGDMNTPKVDGDLRVNKRTNFTFVLPEQNPEVVSREGVVRFIDPRHPGDTLVDHVAKMLAMGHSDIMGMDVSLNIATDSSAVFTIVVDERNGDALTARGRSNLVFSMDKSGRMEMTGGYEVESGAYNLSLSVMKRKFLIQRGSTITWTGDITGANLDITATYTANTPSIDLVANEIAGRTQTELNKFKQKLPFLVTLKMEGPLMKPKITFDISLPPNVLVLWPDVDQKLTQIRTQESELDKQVFALLLLNRFVGEDPLQSAAGGGSSVGSLAFQSASQILTNQLDQLAGSLIKGVDIHFDLNQEQDFSTGNEVDYTELNVSVSKNLFNDRIQVSVGSNFDVQGTGNPNQQASNIAGDVAVDYKLTKDGRYRVRAYRKNQYQAVVEGQVVETGVSFILTFDYNRFMEIFGRTREEKLQERHRDKSSTPQSAPEQSKQ
ncbi:MAG TPA: translocation/assembly module TamB domain-containing protein [Puia sp.]|nr:translocation/assembly module TamB domain-containing protein [Puia sp.]